MVINEQLTKESQEKLKEMKQRALEKGFQFVNTVSTRGEPAKKVCSYAVAWFRDHPEEADLLK